MRGAPLLALFLLLLPPLPAVADLGSAMAAYKAGETGPAADEFRRLAEAGDADAQYMLGYLYAMGDGVPQDYVEAHKWFNLAAAGGKAVAARARDRLARHMTPAQIGEAQRLARAWRPSTPVASAEPPAGLDPEGVAEVQRLLARLGYDPGPADGVMGRKTRRAIEAWQRDSGRPTTGKADAGVLAALREAEPPSSGGPAAGPGGAGERLQELVDRLRRLTRRAEARDAADPWLLKALRGLAAEYHWPWRRTLLEDDFADGDYLHDPSWELVAGSFRVDRGGALHSKVPLRPSRPVQEQRRPDLPTAILGAILEQALGPGGEGAEPSDRAEIRTRVGIPDAFAIELTLTGMAPEAHLEVGPWGGAGDRHYRLAVGLGVAPGLELLRLGPRGETTLGLYPEALPTDRPLALTWTRDGEGEMQVLRDGKRLLRVRDRGASGPYEGLLLVNRGGELAVDRIRVAAP